MIFGGGVLLPQRYTNNTTGPGSLHLDFLTGSLDSRITFSRTTNATLVDATGRVTYAPNNLATYSQEPSNAAWNKTRASITADVMVAPDGTLTGDKLVEDTSVTNTHRTSVAAISMTAGTTYTWSIFLKAGERTSAVVALHSTSAGNAFGTNPLFFVDLLTGAITSVSASVTASSAVLITGGWWRVSVSATATLTTTNTPTVFLAEGGTNAYTGDGVSGLFLWGGQVEAVTYQTLPSTYVQTVASAYYGPRFDYDPVTLAPRGLLIEEQRVNLLLQSQTFDTGWSTVDNVSITANTAISPDGTTTADTLAETAATGIHTASQISSAAGVLTLSVFAKANSGTPFLTIGISRSGIDHCSATFNLNLGTNTASQAHGAYSGASATITAAAQGFYRCTLTVTTDTATVVRIGLNSTGTPTSSNRSFGSTYLGAVTNSIFIYGAQLEVGAFATSYIPTVASTVTRAADVAVMSGSNFSSWYNASEGTYVVSADSFRGTAGAARFVQFDDGTTANNIRSGQSTLQVVDTAVVQVNIAGVPLIPFDGTVFTFASAYKLNDFATVTTGAVATDTSGTVPTVNQLVLGSGGLISPTTFTNGHIRTFTFYATRLTNAQLQALTA